MNESVEVGKAGRGGGLRRLLPALLALIVALAALAAWSNSFSGAFVLDDKPTITLNPAVHDLKNLTRLTKVPLAASTYSRPLPHLTFAMNYAYGGLNVTGYHVFNLAAHILAALALMGLARRTLRMPRLRDAFGAHADWLALVLALLWAVHPLQTAAVTYITQRTEVLASLFYLAALYFFARSVEGGAREKPLRALTVAACFAATASKEISASLPVLVLLYDRAFVAGTFRAAWRERKRFYLALASSWLLLAALIIRAGTMGHTALDVPGYTPLSYLAVQFVAVAKYLKLAFYPSPLIFDYGRGLHAGFGQAAPYAALVLALAGAVVAALRKNHPAGFCGALFFAVLAPTSSFFPIADPIFEHRMYLALAPVVALTVCGAAWLWGRRAGSAARPWPVYAAALILVPALATATYFRNETYHSEYALWFDAWEKNSANPRAARTLGDLAHKGNRLDEAESFYRAAYHLQPTDGDNALGLGLVELKLGKVDEARAHLEEALAANPDDPFATHALGYALLATGEKGRGLGLYARAAQGMNYDATFCLDLLRELADFNLPGPATEFARFLIADAEKRGDRQRVALFSSFLGELKGASPSQ